MVVATGVASVRRAGGRVVRWTAHTWQAILLNTVLLVVHVTGDAHGSVKDTTGLMLLLLMMMMMMIWHETTTTTTPNANATMNQILL